MDYKRKTAILNHKRHFSSFERLMKKGKCRKYAWRRNEVQLHDGKNFLRRR